MFIYSKNLEKAGVTEAALKKAFDKPKRDLAEKHAALQKLIISRIQDGRDSSIKNWRAISAIDAAYDSAHSQITPTLVREILQHDFTPKRVFEKLEAYGLQREAAAMLDLERTAGGEFKEGEVEQPSFFKVMVPLVKAYVTIRLAKLFNDRNIFPMLKYTARQFTAENRIRAEIVTDMVSGIASNYGYKATMRQSILQMLLYSNCLMFPREVWHKDMQEDENGKETRVREGIRYHTPRPERTFFDRHYPTTSFNTDSGCEWAGYWQVEKFGAIVGNKNYYNNGKISATENFFELANYKQYFSEVYPCTVKWPGTSSGILSKQDRESDVSYHVTNDVDKAVIITTFYMKLNPKEWDLGDYDYKVWFRFILANDDRIIFAQPMLYSPVIYWGYDADMNRVTSSSMALEVIPWQDHLGNSLSQILLSSKQNLANAIFFDKNIVGPEVLESLKNKRESQLRSLNFVPFDSLKNFRAGVDTKNAFHEFRFSQHNIAELTNTISTIISIMERLLVMSAQEIGGAATHEQSAREVAIIAGNTGNRVQYTGTFVDDAISAWKKQLYYASMAYMKDNFPSQINPTLFPDAHRILTEMGFEVTEQGNGSNFIGITANTEKLKLTGFADDRDSVNRLQEPAIATVMFQTLAAIAANPMLAEQIGPAKILEGYNMAAQMAGAPPDWKLEPSEEGEQISKAREFAQQLQQMVDQISQQAASQATEAVGSAVQDNSEQINEMGAVLQQLLQAVGQAPPVPDGETPLQ